MRILRGLLCLLVGGSVGLADRPNIILCMADDQGWEETGYNGHPLVKTPVLDEMAATGLRLDRFYSAAPNCGPTRGSIMTGRHPNRFGLFGPNWAMRPEEITLASLVRKAGYATGHFGKWHLGPVKAGAPNNPGAAGFDEWLAHDNFFEMHPKLVRNGAPPKRIEGESSEVIVAAAIEFIKKAMGKRKPFFTVVWFGSPHAPYLASQKDREPYLGKVREDLANRFAEITAMDRAMGQLRDALRSEGVADNTLLWYCSDNGVPRDGLYEPRLSGAKGSLFENGIRVPGIIEWPARIPRSGQLRITGVTTDIFPTVCELVGSPLPDRPSDGVSLVPMIFGRAMKREKPIGFWKYASGPERRNARWLPAEIQKGTTPTTRNPGIDFDNRQHPVAKAKDFGGEAAWFDGGLKLILPKSGKPLLFNVHDDPGEMKDLAPRMPGVVRRMTAGIREWQRSVERSLTGADY